MGNIDTIIGLYEDYWSTYYAEGMDEISARIKELESAEDPESLARMHLGIAKAADYNSEQLVAFAHFLMAYSVLGKNPEIEAMLDKIMGLEERMRAVQCAYSGN